MSTALDLAALAAQGELKIPIARGVVSQGGSGTDYTGWSGVSSVFVEAKVEVRDQSRGFATLTLTVEGSSNGSDWSTLETFTFGHGGTQTATVSAPDDHLRVSWAVGGHSEWQIIEVTAAPSIIDTGGGGGSQPSQSVTISSAQLLALKDTPVTLVSAPAGTDYIVPVRVFYTYRFGTTPYVVTDSAGLVRFQGDSVNLFGIFLDILTGTADQANYENEGQGQPFPLTGVLGKGLQLLLLNANPTGGDGTLEVMTEYVTITP